MASLGQQKAVDAPRTLGSIGANLAKGDVDNLAHKCAAET